MLDNKSQIWGRFYYQLYVLCSESGPCNQYNLYFSRNPKKDFSRNRKLDFCTLLHLILSMQTGTLKDELYKYFSYQTSTASTSAFLQQRSKLADNAFPYLFHSFNELYPYKLYKDKYHLLAASACLWSSCWTRLFRYSDWQDTHTHNLKEKMAPSWIIREI